jgi:hypothetical protein
MLGLRLAIKNHSGRYSFRSNPSWRSILAGRNLKTSDVFGKACRFQQAFSANPGCDIDARGYPNTTSIAIGSWVPIVGIRVEIWIWETNESETVTNEETVTVEEAAACKEAVMEAAIVKRESTTAREMGAASHAATTSGLC